MVTSMCETWMEGVRAELQHFLISQFLGWSLHTDHILEYLPSILPTLQPLLEIIICMLIFTIS